MQPNSEFQIPSSDPNSEIYSYVDGVLNDIYREQEMEAAAVADAAVSTFCNGVESKTEVEPDIATLYKRNNDIDTLRQKYQESNFFNNGFIN